LERGVLHELRIAGVGEPLAGDGVADEVVGDPQVEPGQVAEGVCVLGAREPPDRDRPGVALVFLDESAEPRLDVPDGLLPLRAARLRLTLRGHLPLAEHPDDLLPVLEAASELGPVRHRLEVDPRLGLVAAVAFQAIRLDQRPQPRTRLVRPRTGRGRDGEQPEDHADPPTVPTPRDDSHTTTLLAAPRRPASARRETTDEPRISLQYPMPQGVPRS